MKRIEIDDDLFEMIKNAAEPFVDTSPNDVLRRLLSGAKAPTAKPAEKTTTGKRRGRPPKNAGSTTTAKKTTRKAVAKKKRPRNTEYQNAILKSISAKSFEQPKSNQLLFLNDDAVVYMQNFNKSGTPNMLFRVNAKTFDNLRDAEKKNVFCLCNPTDKFRYELPFEEVDKRIRNAKLNDGYLLINIDVAKNTWRELSWDIAQYKK